MTTTPPPPSPVEQWHKATILEFYGPTGTPALGNIFTEKKKIYRDLKLSDPTGNPS